MMEIKNQSDLGQNSSFCACPSQRSFVLTCHMTASTCAPGAASLQPDQPLLNTRQTDRQAGKLWVSVPKPPDSAADYRFHQQSEDICLVLRLVWRSRSGCVYVCVLCRYVSVAHLPTAVLGPAPSAWVWEELSGCRGTQTCSTLVF